MKFKMHMHPVLCKGIELNNDYWDREFRRQNIERILNTNISEEQFKSLEYVFGPDNYKFIFDEIGEECA